MSARVKVEVLYVEDGGYHAQTLTLPAGGRGEYERLIDFVREDADVLRECYIDVDRVCSVHVVDDDDEDD